MTSKDPSISLDRQLLESQNKVLQVFGNLSDRLLKVNTNRDPSSYFRLNHILNIFLGLKKSFKIIVIRESMKAPTTRHGQKGPRLIQINSIFFKQVLSLRRKRKLTFVEAQIPLKLGVFNGGEMISTFLAVFRELIVSSETNSSEAEFHLILPK